MTSFSIPYAFGVSKGRYKAKWLHANEAIISFWVPTLLLTCPGPRVWTTWDTGRSTDKYVERQQQLEEVEWGRRPLCTWASVAALRLGWPWANPKRPLNFPSFHKMREWHGMIHVKHLARHLLHNKQSLFREFYNHVAVFCPLVASPKFLKAGECPDVAGPLWLLWVI
jgi:hypothetical protein